MAMLKEIPAICRESKTCTPALSSCSSGWSRIILPSESETRIIANVRECNLALHSIHGLCNWQVVPQCACVGSRWCGLWFIWSLNVNNLHGLGRKVISKVLAPHLQFMVLWNTALIRSCLASGAGNIHFLRLFHRVHVSTAAMTFPFTECPTARRLCRIP
jgi:hypothetical protein